MKKIILLLVCLVPLVSNGQAWTQQQIDSANTAKNVLTITDVEREIIAYINLARLYPKQFAKQEVEGYTATEVFGDQLLHSKYKKSLLEDLKKMEPVRRMTFDKEMYDLATCFARESGENGTTGHVRKKCKDGFMAECCSYGMADAKGIVMQWLVDENIPSLGHRKICLGNTFSKIGIGMQTHKVYEYCAVADFTL